MLMRTTILVLALTATATSPCIWDSDTLGDELRGLPDDLRLVTGRWFRHSAEYYQSRIDRLPAELAEHPGDLATYDDLAVAYERLRDREAALAVMSRKKAALDAHGEHDADWNEHLYRYHANQGTFLAHSGRFDEALTELARAIEINPSAHFGRERFQMDAIRYVAACREDPTLWERSDFLGFANVRPENRFFAVTGPMSFSETRRDDAETRKVPWDEIRTAVAGMLRFGGLEGGELYRTLGDLYLSERHLHLAWWAYGVAIERGHPAAEQIERARVGIVKHWTEANQHNGGKRTAIPDAEEFRDVRANAARWLATFHRREREALAAGRDPSQEDELRALIEAADKEVPEVLPVAARAQSAGDGSPAKETKAWGGEPAESPSQSPPAAGTKRGR